jgi:hypothetical protein
MYEILKISNNNLIEEFNNKGNEINNYIENNVVEGQQDFNNYYYDINVCLNEIKSEFLGIDTLISDLPDNQELTGMSKVLAKCQMANSSTMFLIDWLKNKAHSISNAANNAISWLTGKLLPWLTGTVLPWLGTQLQLIFSQIQKITTVKEWKIKGAMGNNFLGFASSEIEITFG